MVIKERAVTRREDMPIGLKFAIVGRTFKSRIDDLMRDSGLTSVQAGVLMALYKMESCGEAEEIMQKDLEEAVRRNNKTMTEIIKKLGANGYTE